MKYRIYKRIILVVTAFIFFLSDYSGLITCLAHGFPRLRREVSAVRRVGRQVCLAQDSASQIQRVEDILEKEEALRERLKEEEQKVLIEKISVEGATRLIREEIERITTPFKSRRLSEKDIRHILELIKEAYSKKGYSGEPFKISYEIEDSCLKIKIQEQAK